MSEIKLVPIRVNYANVFLVVNRNNSILIDTGIKGHTEFILKKMKKEGVQPTDLALIIQTHTHFDHAGNTAELKKLTGAKVMVHENEADCLAKGYTPIPNGTNIYTNFVASLGRKYYPELAAYEAIKPDIVISKKHLLGDFEINGYVFPTPGHTNGSQSIVLEDKTIITGDCFFPLNPVSVFTPYTNDIPQLLKTWENIFALNIQEMYAGHGPKFSLQRAVKCYEKKIKGT